MRKVLLAFFPAALLMACTEDAEQVSFGGSAPLHVDASISTDARSLIGGTSFNASGYKLGVSVFNQQTGADYGVGPSASFNIPYVSTFADGQTSWSSSSSVILSPTVGKAVAYYPYSASVTDIRAIPVDVTKSQSDYMYSGWVSNISAAHPQVSFNMKHALSAVNVFLKRGDYPFEGKVTAVSISSEGFGTSAILNAENGVLANVQGLQNPLNQHVDFILKPDGTSNMLMVVPIVDAPSKAMIIKVTVDSYVYAATVDMSTAFKQGNIYKFPLLLNAGSLEVSTVSIQPWEPGITLDGEMVKPDAE